MVSFLLYDLSKKYIAVYRFGNFTVSQAYFNYQYIYNS